MINAAAAEWQLRRGRLNHQWLKNRVLPALDATDQMLKGRVRANASPRSYLYEQLEDWPGRQRAFSRLFDDFGTQMSPASLVGVETLPGLPSAARDSLRAVVDTLWRARSRVDQSIADASIALEAASAAAKPLREESALSMEPAEFERVIGTFADACRRLAHTVERLPSRSEIV